MNNFETKLKSTFSIDDSTLLIAFLTTLGYCSAYIFEFGYLMYFDVPSNFIQIDLITTLKATAAVVFSLYLFLSVFGLAMDLLKKAHPFWQVIGNAITYILLIAPFIYINTWTSIIHVWFLIGLFLFFVLLSLVPPLFNKNFQTYWSRVKPDIPLRSDSTKSTNEPKSIFSFFIFNGFIFLLFFIFIAGLGGRHAKNESLFWTLKYQPDMVIVRVYGDTIIAKRIDLTTHETIEGIEIFKIDSNSTSIIKSNINFILSKVDKDHLDKIKAIHSPKK